MEDEIAIYNTSTSRMFSSSKRRITHINRNDEGQPNCDAIVSGIFKNMDSNNYGEFCFSINHLKPHKTNSDAAVCGQNKYSNNQTKYITDIKHPLMEKTQKSLKYLKHNRKIPKQRAHVSTSMEPVNPPLKKKPVEEFAKCMKDTMLKAQNNAVKNQRFVNKNFPLTSSKKIETKYNLNQSDLIYKTNNLKNTSVTSESTEYNYKDSPPCSDSEYENFIRKYKVISTDDRSYSFNKTVKRKRKKKFKRIQIRSDSEPDCETFSKVHKEILSTYESDDYDKIVKNKRKKKTEKNTTKKKFISDADGKNLRSTKNALNTDKTKKHCNVKRKSRQVPNKLSNLDFNGIGSSSVDSMELTTGPTAKYSALSRINSQKFNSDFTINVNKPGTSEYIFKHFGCCSVRILRNPHLDEAVLEDMLLEQRNSEKNENLSDIKQHMPYNYEEIVEECFIIQNSLVRDSDFLDQGVLSDTNLDFLDQGMLSDTNFDFLDQAVLSDTNLDFLDQGVLSDKSLINYLEQDNPENNRSNKSDNIQLIYFNDAETDDDCVILEDNLEKGNSVNRSNPSDNKLSNLPYNEECNDEGLIFEYNLNKDDSINSSILKGNLLSEISNNEEFDNECIVLEGNLKKEHFANRSNPNDNSQSNHPNNEESDNECLILENDLSKDDSENRSNLDDNLLSKASINEETDNECLILENDLEKENSVNRSKPSDNTLSDLPNNKIDDKCLILENILNNDNSINRSNPDGHLLSKASNNDIDEECLILCEIPKFPQNASNIKTVHQNYKEVYNDHAYKNDLEGDIQIFSCPGNSELTDKTKLLNKNEQSSFFNSSYSVQNCNTVDMSKTEQFGKRTFNLKQKSTLLNKDYFKHAKRYCDPLVYKEK